MKFTTYDPSNGKIIKSGECPDSMYENQKGEYEILNKASNPSKQYVLNNNIVDMPTKPDGFYNFDYVSKTWVLNQSVTIGTNRSKRNELLLSSDWTQLPDVDLTTAQKDRWKVYRQALRDMTEQDFLDGNFPIF